LPIGSPDFTDKPISTIDLRSMANAHYRDLVRRRREDDAVIPNSKAKVSLPFPG
jgi:hypothetical protein